MLFRTALLIIVWAQAYGQVPLDESDRIGRVRIIIRDSFGNAVDQASATIRPTGGGSNTVTSTSSALLHYGQYIVMVDRSGFERASQKITVDAALTVVVVGLIPGEIEKGGVPRVVQGSVDQFERYRQCHWIRIVPLFSDTHTFQAELSSTGKFRIDGVKPGRYAAMLLSDMEVYRVSDVAILMRDVQSVIVR